MKRQTELEDKLTELDPPYTSAEEASVGRVLDRYGIPFFYRQPTLVYDRGSNHIWKPSFTLPSYGGAVIDYMAAPPAERLTRDRVYRYNQIPAMVLGPPDLDKPNWDKALYAKLQQPYLGSFDPMTYTPTGTDG